MRRLLPLFIVGLFLCSSGAIPEELAQGTTAAEPPSLQGQASNTPPPRLTIIGNVVRETVIVQGKRTPRQSVSPMCGVIEASVEQPLGGKVRMVIPPVPDPDDLPPGFQYQQGRLWPSEMPSSVWRPPPMLAAPVECPGFGAAATLMKDLPATQAGETFRVEGWYCPFTSTSAAQTSLGTLVNSQAKEEGWSVAFYSCPSTHGDECVAYRRIGRTPGGQTSKEVTSCHILIRKGRYLASLTSFTLGTDVQCESTLSLTAKIDYLLNCLPESF